MRLIRIRRSVFDKVDEIWHVEAVRVMRNPFLYSIIICGLVATNLLGHSMELAPESNPPVRSVDYKVDPSKYSIAQLDKNVTAAAIPSVEWLFHKTEDGAHPSGGEQQLVWLMNRARSNPMAEGMWLAQVPQKDVQNAMKYFSVDKAVLVQEFIAFNKQPPAAFDVRLYRAALAHSEYLISVDGQNHDGQFDRIDEEGVMLTSARGSVFSYADDALYGHAGFNIDWGYGDSGMQASRGHRLGIMGNYSCVGVACVEEDDSTTSVGPNVITINYCNVWSLADNHYNRFIVGTVWADLNDNDLYDPGEGIEDVTVLPDQGRYYAVTGQAGGYAIPLLTEGEYQLIFSGEGLPDPVTKTVQVGANSVLVDVCTTEVPEGMSLSLARNEDGTVSFHLRTQRKGCAYGLLSSSGLKEGEWQWSGVLPTESGDGLLFRTNLRDAETDQHFLMLRGWRY